MVTLSGGLLFFAALIYMREYLAFLGDWGYPGVILVGLACGVAATLGDLSVYILGTREKRVARRGRLNNWLLHHMDRWGAPSLFTVSVLPAPSGVLSMWAGTVHYPIRRFLLFVFAGKVAKLTGIAFLGFYSLPSLLP